METTSTPGAAAGPAPPGEDEVRGLREQAARLRDAALGLVRAHLDLARAEFSEITGELKALLGLVGLAAGAALWAALLLLVGVPLFLGEWLFGSIAWGILDGLLALAGVAVAATVVALGAAGGLVARAALVGLAAGVAVGAWLGTNVARMLAFEVTRQGAQLYGWSLPAGWEHVVVGLAGGALVGLAGGLVAAAVARPGVGGAVGLAVGGAVLFALLGWFSVGIEFSLHGAAAIGLAVGLAAWPLATGLSAAGRIDPEAGMQRLYPRTTIETARETVAWVRELIRPGSR